MHFNFYLSKNGEKEEIVEIFQDDDPYGIPARAKQYGISENLAKKINSAPREEWENDLDLVLTEAYRINEKKLNESLEFFKTFWNENDKYYFDILEKAIEEKIEKYNVLLTHFVAGTSDWEGNNICTNAYSKGIIRNKNAHVYYLLFEVILSHFFKKIRKVRKDLEDLQIWAMTELISFTILHNEFDLFESEANTNYKEVDSHINEAKNLYKNSNNINKFIEEIIKIYERK
ncbi:MAG TPA: hypothetical protein VLL98_04120 [Rickettsiales bacterium]|nr:hypothetical protein [Rickettsiales bacterium]